MQIRIGSLVMWNMKDSRYYGCLGLVTNLWERGKFDKILYFHAKWADEESADYNMSDINDNNIKVVKF